MFPENVDRKTGMQSRVQGVIYKSTNLLRVRISIVSMIVHAQLPNGGASECHKIVEFSITFVS